MNVSNESDCRFLDNRANKDQVYSQSTPVLRCATAFDVLCPACEKPPSSDLMVSHPPAASTSWVCPRRQDVLERWLACPHFAPQRRACGAWSSSPLLEDAESVLGSRQGRTAAHPRWRQRRRRQPSSVPSTRRGRLRPIPGLVPRSLCRRLGRILASARLILQGERWSADSSPLRSQERLRGAADRMSWCVPTGEVARCGSASHAARMCPSLRRAPRGRSPRARRR